MRMIHSTAVIYVLRPDSNLASHIQPGSGIVGVPGHHHLHIYYEGNLYDASNLRDPLERVVCAFGRAASMAPTVAMMAVLPCDLGGLVRVGEIHWPNRITWDSDLSERIFREYAGRSRAHPVGKRQGISHTNILEVFAPAILGDYDVPQERDEWRWIEAQALFEHVGNGVEPGVWEFQLRVRSGREDDDYDAAPPARLAEIIGWARDHSYAYILFHQG